MGIIGNAGKFKNITVGTISAARGSNSEKAKEARNDVFHGTNFWKHLSTGDHDNAESSLQKMKNPALQKYGGNILKAHKIMSKNRLTRSAANKLAMGYHMTGSVLAKQIGATNINNQNNNRSNKQNNQNKQNNKEVPVNHNTINEGHVTHLINASNEIEQTLIKFLEGPYDESTKNNLREALKIIQQNTSKNPLQGGSSHSSRKGKKSQKGRKGKRVTRKRRHRSVKKTKLSKSKRKTRSRRTK